MTLFRVHSILVALGDTDLAPRLVEGTGDVGLEELVAPGDLCVPIWMGWNVPPSSFPALRQRDAGRGCECRVGCGTWM